MTVATKRATDTVTVRLPVSEIVGLEAEAAAAHMTRSAYIQMLLSGRSPPESSAPLAALAQLISLCSTIKAAQIVAPQQLLDLQLLVRTLALAAREEPSRDR